MKSRRLSSKVLFWSIASTALTIFLFQNFASISSAPATNSNTQSSGNGCNDPYDTRNLSKMAGLNTKWLAYSTRLLDQTGYYESDDNGTKDTRVTIQPFLGGLSAVEWMNVVNNFALNQAADRVNRLTLNLDPGKDLLKPDNTDPKRITDSEWTRYKEISFKNRNSLAASDVEFLKSIQKRIDKLKFTVEQRNGLLLAFLIQLEGSLETSDGALCSANPLFNHRIPFILHQRRYIENTKYIDHANQFADEMSEFINRVRNYDQKHGTKLTRWIAGVRLGENNSPNAALWKKSVIHIAKRINSATDNFLQNREFIANGPVMGMNFSGINITDTFIETMASQTNSFAAGYKFMAEGNLPIGTAMTNTMCGTKNCDKLKLNDWKYFIEVNGFDELKKYMHDNYRAYPRHSNVVWVGDSGDAMASFYEYDEEKKITIERASLQALASKFFYASSDASIVDGTPNFQGFLFMEAMASEILFNGDKPAEKNHDFGKYMLYMNQSVGSTQSPWEWVPDINNSYDANEKTIYLWKNWPNLYDFENEENEENE